MVFDLAITAVGILPFYLGLIGVVTRQFHAKFSRLLWLFLVSGLATVPFFALRSAGISEEMIASVLGPLFAISLLAFAEELVKSIALLFDKELKKHIYYPIVVGLSFACFENFSYFFGFNFTTGFLAIAVIRLFVGSTAHAVFTTLVAHVMNKGLKRTRTLFYLAGVMLAGSFHSFFNLLHHWEMSYMTIPLLVLLIVYLHFDHRRIHQKKTQTKVSLRSARARS